jgi:hypothetical protein
MPDFAERSSDMGIAQNTAAVATTAQISPAFLHNCQLRMVFACQPKKPKLTFLGSVQNSVLLCFFSYLVHFDVIMRKLIFE